MSCIKNNESYIFTTIIFEPRRIFFPPRILCNIFAAVCKTTPIVVVGWSAMSWCIVLAIAVWCNTSTWWHLYLLLPPPPIIMSLPPSTWGISRAYIPYGCSTYTVPHFDSLCGAVRVVNIRYLRLLYLMSIHPWLKMPHSVAFSPCIIASSCHVYTSI